MVPQELYEGCALKTRLEGSVPLSSDFLGREYDGHEYPSNVTCSHAILVEEPAAGGCFAPNGGTRHELHNCCPLREAYGSAGNPDSVPRTRTLRAPQEVLSVLAILFAAAAPFLGSRTPLQTTPADEIGGALLAVALIILVTDRSG